MSRISLLPIILDCCHDIKLEEVLSQGCETNTLSSIDQEACPIMDPLSLTVSAIALAGTGIKTASSFNSFCTDYREAKKQGLHAERQRSQLQASRAHLNSLPPALRHNIVSDKQLADLEAAIPQELKTSKKRDRLRWATGCKNKVAANLARLNESETSTTFALVLATLEEVGQLKENVSTIQHELSAIRTNLAEKVAPFNSNASSQKKRTRDLLDLVSYTLEIAHTVSKPYSSSQFYWCKWLNQYLGIKASVIVSRGYNQNTYRIFFRWPLIWAKVLSGPPYQQCYFYLSISFPTNHLSLKPVQRLITSGKAHPNDTTPDNLTLLRFAVRSGHDAVVKVLLELGANPNITFGLRKTSPLNNAFLCGHTKIIRMLIAAGADLEYVNSRTWTSLYYLWDPEIRNHDAIPEILDICLAQNFDFWNHADSMGWAPVHRAAAFGEAHHIRKLRHLDIVNFDQCTLHTKWLPIQCAARYGNISTFKAFMEIFYWPSLLHLRDSRGWTLLHLASQSGSRELISHLLELGADPTVVSDRSSVLVPGVLEYQDLLPETIAKHYGHGQIFAEALRAAKYTDFRAEEGEPDLLVELP